LEQFAYNTTSQDGFFKLNHSSPLLSHYDQCVIMQKLMADIDLTAMFHTYFKQVCHYLKISGVSLKYATGELQLGDCSSKRSCKTLMLQDEHKVIAQLHYFHDKAFTLHDWQVMQELHHCSKQLLKNAIQHQQVKKLALKDPLTTLGNRASYDEQIHRQISLALRHKQSFGLLVIDLDNFKPVNDKYGHKKGDQILKRFSEVLNSALRDTDMAFRLGGDEFCCILQSNSGHSQQGVADRIQRAVNADQQLKNFGVSCSIGNASFSQHDDANSIFERADQALYQAKASGRNCVRCANSQDQNI